MINNRWKSFIKFNWLLGLFLIFFFGVLRFKLVLYSIQSGDNKYLSLLFGLMIITPFLLLNKKGRNYIGIKKIKNPRWILYSFLIGLLLCSFAYLIGQLLYYNEISNWFKYIGESYPIDLVSIPENDKTVYFIIFVLIGMSFSPFGEELLYRGIVHGSLVSKFGEYKSAIIDSAAFGLTHLAHFGLIYSQDKWTFLPLPAFIWVVLVFTTGIFFNYCKTKSGSIWGAIICHMSFNIAMTYYIFYCIF